MRFIFILMLFKAYKDTLSGSR